MAEGDGNLRANGPFTKDQCTFIIFHYGKYDQCLVSVRREFRKRYYPNNPGLVPSKMAFHRVVKRFVCTGSITPSGKSVGKQGRNRHSDMDIQNVKSFFQDNERSSIREAVNLLGLSYGVIWTILRQDLKWKPYKVHHVQQLSPENKESRDRL